MASICILTGSHLCRNPRVVKEAAALSDAGYAVTVLGPILSEELSTLDAEISRNSNWEFQNTIDLRRDFSNPALRFGMRTARRFSGEAVRFFNWQLPQALGYGVGHTLTAAKRYRHDLYIAHQEVGSWAGYELGMEGYRVGADLEDWYSRDLLPEAQEKRPLRLLRKCESFLLKKGAHVTTTSYAMAKALAKTYGARLPTVIYNCFPWSDRAGLDFNPRDRSSRSLPSLHWTSQTIGPGRGLDVLCRALEKMDNPVAVHLRGTCNPTTASWIRELFPSRNGHELYLHGLVPPGELLSRIAEHDIGLALEPVVPDSRNLTVTNKILHYLVAGLATVATGTVGQCEIAEAAPAAVLISRAGDAADLANKLNLLIQQPTLLKTTKEAALKAAKNLYCWERQVPVLLDSVEKAIGIK